MSSYYSYMKLVVFMLMLLWLGKGFLEFQMVRIPVSTTFKSKDKGRCITKEIDEELEKKNRAKAQDDDEDEQDQVDEEQNYQEICYEKDISYSIPLYYHDSILYFSLDLTAPISWLKGQNCKLEASTKKCTYLTENIKDALEGISHSLTKHFSKKKKKSEKLAMIEGSSELVKGELQKSKNLEFRTQDSSRFTKFTELLMLGFWMRGEKDFLEIQSTTFINATELSSNLNSLCDGAISLRFDEMSEKSFLKEIFDYVKTSQKVITVYLGGGENKQPILTIGEITTKNTEMGYGGINWMSMESDDNYGKLPNIVDVIVENGEGDSDEDMEEMEEIEIPTVLTLSASYIGLPTKLINAIKKQYKSNRECKVNEDGFFECAKIRDQDLETILTFNFNGAKVSFKTEELVLERHHKKVVFNIKKTFKEDYAIMGEPLFKKYFTILDYGKNRIGIGPPRVTLHKEFIGIATLVRFVSFVFIFGFAFILCFTPLQRAFKILKNKGSSIFNRKSKDSSSQTRRLRQYTPVQEENYDELNEKVKEALDDDAEGI